MVRNIIVRGVFVALLLSLRISLFSQSNVFFTDGFHGGIYGHYPINYTTYMADELDKNPLWKINLEIEPETWDTIQVRDPKGYLRWKAMLENPESLQRIEFVNPTYGQPYMFNISGESLIRQFQYGIKKIRQHFPQVQFLTYSCEEPCFTSALPNIIKPLGFQYAVLKNPNTCWGGYFKAFGGEVLNWKGPDGTSVLAVPRYSCEQLEPKSTWQTIAWRLTDSYLDSCFSIRINEPVGMCYQDAGWKNGPWLGANPKSKHPATYILWHDYFKRKASQSWPDHRFSQEDVLPGLVWGAQVLQQLSQQIRISENKLVQTEKIASMLCVLKGSGYPKDRFDHAWRPLLLSQHHDCWIVPYNGRHGNTWADMVKRWTAYTNSVCDSIAGEMSVLDNQPFKDRQLIRVYNSTGVYRKSLVSYMMPESCMGKIQVKDKEGNICPSQWKHHKGMAELLFFAEVPAMGYSTYVITIGKTEKAKGAICQTLRDGKVKLETDLYELILDPSKGGTIVLLKRKKDGFNFVGTGENGVFNGLRGYFYDDGGFYQSSTSNANITVLDPGPLKVSVLICGAVNGQPFRQTISLVQGQPLIDCSLEVDWKGKPRLGAYNQQKNFKAENPEKAFYNDRFKLHLSFPFGDKNQIFKDAPFDVCKSNLSNTFFNRWDSLKNNVVLHWVDAYDTSSNKGLCLFTDHTTSYLYGDGEPLGLTVQYVGIGLWGRNYTVDSLTHIRYGLFPHDGTWDTATIPEENSSWNEALVVKPVDSSVSNPMSFSLFEMVEPGIEVTSMTMKDNQLQIRLYNVSCKDSIQHVKLFFDCDKVEAIDLQELPEEKQPGVNATQKSLEIKLTIPRFGIKTLRCKLRK